MSLDEIIKKGPRPRTGGAMRTDRQGARSGKPYQRKAAPLSRTPFPSAPALPAVPMQDLFAYFAAFTAMMQQQQQQSPLIGGPAMMSPEQFMKSMAQMQGGPLEVADNLTVKISQNRTPKGIAEDVANAMQYGDPVIFCCGVNAINQAVKGVAVLRNNMLKESGGRRDCCVWPHYREEARNSLSFVVQQCQAVRKEEEWSELKVAGQSEIEKVAGGISHRVRNGEKVCLITMGPLAASSAVAAVVYARRHLKNDGLDLSFRPQFVTLEPQEGQESRSAVQFRIYSQRQ